MAQSNWEADKMLDVYINDYLMKRNLHATAKAFISEAKVTNDPQLMLLEGFSLNGGPSFGTSSMLELTKSTPKQLHHI